ncbi:secreted acid phosphatase [Fusarium heterosporum]|uniref:3-phytase n=1 Tax=Fusarium heterosporum TaxID=42747 RepID=A0A8H5TCZ2_FUSHE|nr:secreted acid phosphatase [Fusarium heterosporum]
MRGPILAAAVFSTCGLASTAKSGSSLDPVQAILLPDTAAAKSPLTHLGGNGPWHIGEPVTGISSEVPEGCHVDQVAYISRHGSRYPDSGAHSGWVDMARRFKESKYTATGPLSFFHTWDTPLTNPAIQIAQLSKTGYKELFDMGYTIRTRYPDLYQEGDNFVVWANNYTRVLQTAKLFLHGFLGTNSSLGTVVSVTGKGFPAHLGDTLAPSDMCPTFVDDSDKQIDVWRSYWLPAFKKRLSKYIGGDLELEDGQWNDFPYICGFESQITGRLSPFCETFTQKELEQYEYQQDIRYYYGVGPGAKVGSKMMVPFLESLIQRFVVGPDATGTNFDGQPFKIPKILMSFLNDGQLNELVAATGVFDKEKPLPLDHIPKDRLWRSSNISPMRGTIAFESLNCGAKKGNNSKRFIRVLINDVVFSVPSCHDGPGKSCSLPKYSKFLKNRLRKNGNFAKLCNATDAATPSKVLGASFFTDLAQPHLKPVEP